SQIALDRSSSRGDRIGEFALIEDQARRGPAFVQQHPSQELDVAAAQGAIAAQVAEVDVAAIPQVLDHREQGGAPRRSRRLGPIDETAEARLLTALLQQ